MRLDGLAGQLRRLVGGWGLAALAWRAALVMTAVLVTLLVLQRSRVAEDGPPTSEVPRVASGLSSEEARPDDGDRHPTSRTPVRAGGTRVRRGAASEAERREAAQPPADVRSSPASSPPAVEKPETPQIRASGQARPPLARPVSEPIPDGAVSNPQLAKFDFPLRQVAAGNPSWHARVIVRTKSGKRAATALGLADRGGFLHADHPLISAFTATVSASDLLAFSRDPDIERVSIDAVVRANQEPYTSGEVLRDTLGLLPGGGVTSGDESWAGRRICVAVVDSGIEPSKDIERDRITAFYDFTNGVVAVAPYDDNGHGNPRGGVDRWQRRPLVRRVPGRSVESSLRGAKSARCQRCRVHE